jgi:hypothetical protein
MRHQPFACLRLVTPVAVVALAAAAPAQWYSLPYNSPQSVYATDWLVTHSTPTGIAVFSAIAQRWDIMSPAGSIHQQINDSLVITREGTNTLRGWSAWTNESATQTVANSYSFESGFNALTYAALNDSAPFTNGVLRAYSSLTNTWASKPLSQLAVFSMVAGANVIAQKDGLNYHAYSPYTGQWTTLAVAQAGGNPISGIDFVAVDLRGTSGPFQYAAFSARRGTWTLSPVYPSTGAGAVVSSAANAFAIRTDTGTPGQFTYSAYSAVTGQWVTSSLPHTAASVQSTLAYKNVERIQDSNAAARFEIFGAANGIWQQLTGSNLTEESVHDDFHVVTNSSGSSCTVSIASALVGGGYTSVVVPSFFPSVTPGAHQCLVYGGTLPTLSAWGYSPATNTFAGPVPFVAASGSSLASAPAVGGFNSKGSGSVGTSLMAFSARNGTWRAGPTIQSGEGWDTYANGGMLVGIRTVPTPLMQVYDEHRDAWLAPVAGAGWTAGTSLIANLGGGTFTGYSVHRGTWSTATGFGSITSGGGLITLTENLAWFTDSLNQIRVFASPARTQVWSQWPLSSRFATSGSGPGISTQFVGVSTRGTPTQYGLLYAALALPPAPITIPGLTGALDLDLGTAVQVADLGLFDADGVRQVRIPVPGSVAANTRLWLQLVTVDLVTGQIDLPERASGACFF